MKKLYLVLNFTAIATLTPYAQASEKREPEPMSYPDVIAEKMRSWRQSLANQIQKGILPTKTPNEQSDVLYYGSKDLAAKMRSERDRMPELLEIAQYLHEHCNEVNIPLVTKSELLDIATQRGQIAGEIVKLLSPKEALAPENNRVHNMTNFISPFIDPDDLTGIMTNLMDLNAQGLPEAFSNLMTEEQAQSLSEQCLKKLAETGALSATIAKLLTKEQTQNLAEKLLTQLPEKSDQRIVAIRVLQNAIAPKKIASFTTDDGKVSSVLKKEPVIEETSAIEEHKEDTQSKKKDKK